MYLLNHAGKAGTERYVLNLVQKLNKNKIKAFFAYNEDGLLVNRLKDEGVDTYRIEMKNPFDLGAAYKLAALCKKLDIDVIHSQFLRENYIAILSKLFNRKVKVIYTNHFVISNNSVQKITNRILTRFDSYIISVCNIGKDYLIRNGNNAEKIKVIFNGIDTQYFNSEVPSDLRKRFNIPEDTFIMLCASRFAHDKGHEYLIDAIFELKKITGKDFRMVLAGDGPLLENIKDKAKDLDEVIFTGFVKDIRNMFYGSNIYINPSEHEALSFLIIEALASGLPVIATDMGGNSDIINKKTDCGSLVKYNEPEVLAKAMLTLMEDPVLCDKYSKNAKLAVKKYFNLDNVVEETYNLYVASIK